MNTIEQGPQQIIDKTALLYQNGPKRQTTLEIRDLLRRPEITQDAEVDISTIASKALAYLRTAHEGIYSEYGRKDIIEGLGAIDHPVAQTAVIESLLDESPIVAKTAERILLDPNRYIYPETLEALLDHDDSEVKELGIRIIEHNPKAGVTPDGNVDSRVLQTLYNMTVTLEPETKDQKTLKKGAILISLLYERTNGKIPDTLSIYAEHFLVNDINTRIGRLIETNTFVKLVASIADANETSARTATNIETLTLALPQQLENDPEELTALARLLPTGIGFDSSQETVIKYKSLVAFMKERVRENLTKRVTQIKAQEEAKQRQLQTQIDEANRLTLLKLQEDQERQAQIRREEREVQLALVQKAKQWFPHL